MFLKLIYVLVGTLSCMLFLSIGLSYLIKFIVLKNYDLSIDLSVIFNDERYFKILIVVGVIIALCFVIAQLETSGKKKKTKDDKVNYSKLASVYEAKKGTVRLEFNDTHIKYPTFLDIIDRLFNPFKKFYNRMISFFRINDVHKLNTIKKWKIDDQVVTKRGGLPIYMSRFFKGRMYVDGSDSHTNIVGTTNSGKTFSMVLQLIESLRMAGESMVINDMKGELLEYTGKQLEEAGYHIVTLNFTDVDASDDWYIFQHPWELWKEECETYEKELEAWEEEKRGLTADELELHYLKKPRVDHSGAVEYLMDMGKILTYDEKVNDKFWNDSAADLIVGLMAFLMEEGKEEYINSKSLNILLNMATQSISPTERTKYGLKSNTMLGAYMEKYRKVDDVSYTRLKSFLESSDATRNSIKSVTASKLSPLTMNEKIMRMTSRSSFDVKELGQKKMAIYLIVHDEKQTYYPMVTIFIKQLYETLINDARSTGGRLKIPVNLIIDEAGQLPPLKDIQSIVTAGRSRGIRIYFAWQEFNQITQKYGKEGAQIIKNNCTNTVYILGSQEETLQEFSKMCGSHQIWIPSRKMYEVRTLISTDRLRKLNLGEVVIHRQRKNAFITRMRPYDKCLFYKGKRYDIHQKKNSKQPVYYYDLSREYNRMLEEIGTVKGSKENDKGKNRRN